MTGTAARPVVWDALRLRGFGRHADLHVAFPAGLGVWVAPNEAGKSTALMGLVATIWGLPHLQDADGFTWARFRAWSGGPHRGEVLLRAGDESFSVHREFETHRVRVFAHAVDGDRLLLDVAHNPNARKETTPYVAWLARTLGLTEAPVVLATFVVAQGGLGGHPHALGSDVQGLVAGAGAGGWTVARDRLEAALRARTRRLRGLAPSLVRDGTVDRALEEAEARVVGLEAALRDGRAVADAFERTQQQVHQAQQGREEARDRRRRLAAAVEAHRGWRERRDALWRARRRHAERDRAAVTARLRWTEVERARAAADACHPELRDAPGDLEERLAGWAAARVSRDEQRIRLDEARGTRDAAVRSARAAVAAAIAAERSVPTSPRDWSAWGAPAGPAVAAVAAAAPRWRAHLGEAWSARAAHERLEAALLPLAAFDDVDAALVPGLRGYLATRDAWADRVASARGVADRAQERVEEHDERFGPVRGLPLATASALRSFAAAFERVDGTGPLRWLGAVAWFVTLGWGGSWVAASAGWGTPTWASWALGAVCAVAWVLVLPRRPALRRARRRLDALVRQGAPGPDAGDDDLRLELARRLEAFDALGEDVARAVAELAVAEAGRATAEAGADAFDAVWGPLREALVAAGAPPTVDLGEAHARYVRMVAEREVAAARSAAAARALSVRDPDDVAPYAPAHAAGGVGARLAAWARFQGAVGDGATVGDVAAWLDRLSAATWTRWREEAATADRLGEGRATAADRRALAEGEAARTVLEHERAVAREDEALVAAGAALDAAREHARGAGEGGARFPLEDDPRAVGRAWRARISSEAEAAAAEGALAAHLQAIGGGDLAEGVVAAEDAARDAGVETMAALTAWRSWVADYPSLPPADPEVFRDGSETFRGAADARGWPGDADRTDAGRARDPGEDVEAAFDAAHRDLDAAVRAHDTAEQAYLDARERLVRIQGVDPIDVAAAEVDLAEARRDVERIRGERDALTLALRTLGEAVDDFRSEHLWRLERATATSFARFTGVPGRRVGLDEAFVARVIEPSGDVAVPGQLSQGARDQLALSLRLAVADLLADDVRLPLILDDPFLNWDEDRLARAAEALAILAAERQVIVLSHRASTASWGPAVVARAGEAAS